MTVRTPQFGLEAFIVGDIYSAAVDQRRFTIIDSHMAFLSDLIGPGKIKGWDLSIPSPYTLSVSSGWGMIGRSITRTFGDYKKSLLDNSSIYVWMRIRPGVIGQISAFSNIAYLDYVDNTPPVSPSLLSIKSKSIDSCTIQWKVSTELDFYNYEIYRSNDNINYSLVSESFINEFSDSNLLENTIYYYKIKAYDLSGNGSNFSQTLLVITDKDLSKPSDPGSVKIINTKNAVHLSWNSAPYGKISYYRAYVTPVNEERISTGETFIVDVDGSSVDMTIRNLSNEQRYLIVLKSVSIRDVESNGITRLGIPIDTGGPPDVAEISIIDYESDTGVSKNGINIIWSSDVDPYSSFDGSSEILIEEYRLDGTVLVSNLIPTLSGSYTRSIDVFPYIKDGLTYYKSIEPRTTYYITIKNIDVNGIKSAGKRVKHYTKNFIRPESVQSISVTDRTDNALLLRWENSSSYFSYNILSISRLNISDSSQLSIVNRKNVGKATIFLLDPSYSQANSRYTFTLSCIDEFGNESDSRSVIYEISNIVDLPKPPPPQQQIGYSGDKQNILTWNSAQTDLVKGYNIYRANDSASLSSEDFLLLERVPFTSYTYVDYEVENGLSYVYFVTTVDIYENESLNPINDKYINYPLTTLKPAPSSTLNRPSGLQQQILGNSVQLSWQPTGGEFDGYEIYRSIGNKYSFKLIATTSPAITYYVDSSALSKTGRIYYIVRKFRNESDIFVTESNVNITNAVYLGKVSTNNGISTIDLTGVKNISKLEDPVRDETKARIAIHKHEWIDEFNDRRINLSDKLLVSDWTTDDNQTYFTQTDISETTTFTIYLNEEDASSFGLLYSVNKLEGSITFEKRLAATGFEIDKNLTFEFSVPPKLSVEFDNLEETKSILPKNRLDNFSAQQIGVGIFERVQIPNINHDGRIKEKLEPIQISTISIDDGYRYAPQIATESIGNAVVFYDIMQAFGDSDTLVASTSDGIYTSEDFGVSWNRRFEPDTPVIKFYYSNKYDTYFAGTNRGILFGRGGSAGGFSVWTEVAGAENSKIIRDIISDQDGNVFCSTDLGVYRLRRDIGQGSFFFQQTPILGPRSTEAYAMLFDELRGRMIVSNELGIFESYNNGVLWSFTDEFTEQRPIFCFAQSNGFIFAITDFMLWRRKPNDQFFERIGVMENSSIARKIVIWNNRIYISTDNGLLVTVYESDIFFDATVSFEQSFAELRFNSTILPSTSLNLIDNKLFVGSENKMFISNKPGKISLHSEFSNKTTPTVYINGEQQYIGYRFTTSQNRLKKFVCFDVKQKFNSVVTIANQYKVFRAKNGGWADVDYLSSVSLFIDGFRVNRMSLAEKPAQEISQMSLPLYNDRVAHKEGADIANTQFETARTNLLAVERSSDGQITKLSGFTKNNVVLTLYSIERFISQIYVTARIIETTNEDGTVSKVDFKIPSFRVLLLNNSSNIKATNISNFGTYKIWSNNTENSQPSVIGHFGNELDPDGVLPVNLIGDSL